MTTSDNKLASLGAAWGGACAEEQLLASSGFPRGGSYNAAGVWGEYIITPLLGKGDVHYNVCSSCAALQVC